MDLKKNLSAFITLAILCVTSPLWGAFAVVTELSLDQLNPGDRITVYEKSGRILELIVEEVKKDTDRPGIASDITGRYSSDISSNHIYFFPYKIHRKMVITLDQKGARITGGDYSTQSEITGTREADTIKFDFWSRQVNSGWSVTGEWQISADGRQLIGSWASDSGAANGQWNLSKLSSGPAVRDSESAVIRGRRISDQSSVEILVTNIEKLEQMSSAGIVSLESGEASLAAKEVVPQSDETPGSHSYDGSWEFGLGWDLVEQSNIDAFDGNGANDIGFGWFIGKDLAETESWITGGQLHVLRSLSEGDGFLDEVIFNATSFFATARPKAIPFIQFKAGLTSARYENDLGNHSKTGLAYGLGLVTGNGRVRLHWLDYQIYKLGNDKFETLSINVVFWLCLLGACR